MDVEGRERLEKEWNSGGVGVEWAWCGRVVAWMLNPVRKVNWEGVSGLSGLSGWVDGW